MSGDMPAYDRDEWRHWIDEDEDCQDTRQEALVAESVSPVEYTDSDQCRVTSGEWVDPYSGVLYADPSDLQIDHLVPLANAHASGGWAWSESRKRVYANDLSFAGHLVAVHGPANQAKGKSGPEDWQPPASSYWCQYAIDWITIKNSWGLTATEAEFAALAEMLDTCEPRRMLEALEPGARPAATATTVALSDGAYATCDAAEAAGEQRMQGNEGSGWGFPRSMVPTARDGDSDGIVCELTIRSATPSPGAVLIPTTATPRPANAAPSDKADGAYASCDEAEAAGELRVQGSQGSGRGFPQSAVPSARDGDRDGVVCELTVRSATPTPGPVATPASEASPAATGTASVYDSCDAAEAAGEERVQGSSGSGRGFPQSVVPSARDGDDDGVVCEVTVRSATPTPKPVATPTTVPQPPATAAPEDESDGAYATCEEAEAAGEERVQGSSGSGRGFPQSMVPSARDGDDDGVVCEETVRSATPTPGPVVGPTTAPQPPATAVPSGESDATYASCEEAEAAGEERVQGSKGSGRGFPQSVVPSARDGDSDGVVCEEAARSATPTPDAPPTDSGSEGVYATCGDAEAAGEERVQGSSGSGRGFPQSMVPTARDGDNDGVVCEVTVRSPTPTPEPGATPTTEAPPADSGTESVYDSCDDAEAAGEERIQGSSGSGRGFPQSMVPSARDGDDDGVVCEVTVRSPTPTPGPVVGPTIEAPLADAGTESVYDSCDAAEAAGEERVQGSSGSGRGFPQAMVPSARDGDSDGVVCEVTVRSPTPTPGPAADPTTEAPPADTGTESVYDSCDEAEAAREERVQGSSGSGRGFPQSMVPSARDGDGDGVVCER